MAKSLSTQTMVVLAGKLLSNHCMEKLQRLELSQLVHHKLMMVEKVCPKRIMP